MRHVKEEPRKKKKGKAVVLIILFVFIIGFAFGAFMLVRTLLNAKHEQETFDGLTLMVQDTDEVDEDTGALRKYDELYNKNPDFFGWLKVDGTKIDYPVMYSPEEPERYLHLDFYGKYSDSGMLFVDGDCPKDGDYFLIYGHHMNNGTMFGQLPKYSDYEFYKEHKTLFFDTRYELGDYEVVAAFETKIYPVDEEKDHFCYYNYKDLSSPSKFEEYVAGIKSLSRYDTGITPKYGDELLALSTCNYHTDNGRFVVVARKIKEQKSK